jgi:hypothetical protein
MQQQHADGSSSLGVALAWTVVMIPLLWGVYTTFLNIVKLFQ